MRYSTELEILIETMKVSLLEHNTDHLKTLLSKQKIDWQRFERMAIFHAIRPVVFDACNKAEFTNEVISRFRLFCLKQVTQNLIVANELVSLAQNFQNHNISFLPYKGLSFLEKLYDKKPLREIGDLDLLIHPSDATNALKLLFEAGYGWSKKVQVPDTTESSISQVLTYFGREAELQKEGVIIDFHWGVYETFRNFKVDIHELFDNYKPASQQILKQMLIHHAGRDSWLKLKYIADLMMFLKKYQNEINWEELHQKLGEWKIQKASFYGIHLGSKMFFFELNTDLKGCLKNHHADERTTKFLFSFWETATEIRTIRSKIKYLKIYHKLQDFGFSMAHYLYRYFKANSIPNPIEQKRVITFPDNYPFLNFISKAITILLRKTT